MSCSQHSLIDLTGRGSLCLRPSPPSNKNDQTGHRNGDDDYDKNADHISVFI
ncbi:hypothetical protein DPMN_069036 [Dreissena polymorpha]|uniref:Uncharacterized protein n=1 Tax=Dreissena polymorpha TaxID=45954 RepID=A0A9D3Z3C8_DREPO|nr:hypothetical protein DPMN_069036 [Dreissena polymorpha]